MDSLSIPKIIHLIWYQGWEERPGFGREYSQTWEQEHPDWTILRWDKDMLEFFFKGILCDDLDNALDSLPEIVQKVDLWRLIILFHMGGVYVDLDFVCLRNITSYLNGFEFVVSEESENNAGIIANGFIASVKHHGMIRRALDDILNIGIPKCLAWENDDVVRRTKKYVLETTGPHLVSKAWRDEFGNMSEEEKKKIHIETNYSLFFPKMYSEYDVSNNVSTVDELKQHYPNSYAVHMYWGSWTYNKRLFAK